MVRSFFRDSAIYVLPSALSSGMSFFLFPFYAHHSTASEYDLFDLVMLGSMLVGGRSRSRSTRASVAMWQSKRTP